MTLETLQHLIWFIALVLCGILAVSILVLVTLTYYLAQIARETRLTRIMRD